MSKDNKVRRDSTGVVTMAKDNKARDAKLRLARTQFQVAQDALSAVLRDSGNPDDRYAEARHCIVRAEVLISEAERLP